MPARKSTTERGLGWQHQQDKRRTLARHKDGDPCPCLDLNDCGPACLCRPHGEGLPMYRDAARNPDGMPLELDHTLARSQGGTRGDRLLLATCNRSRGDGTRTTDAVPFTRPEWWTDNWFDVPTTPTPGDGRPGAGDRLVVLLCGPAGAGKTTAARVSGLTVYDRDDPQWTTETQFTTALAQLAADPHARAVVIRAGATSSARAKAAALTGATHIYLLLLDQAELGHRVAHRNRADKHAGLASIRTWFERFDRDDDVEDFPGWAALGIRQAATV
ncbi:hypothetical protein [Blastococcus sp. CT_GayMR16]|uniref:hypothetical protein n=1 Tax=Blastococcus sp. CT_GayMR16 TaxID=2559607 RepID=UPI001073D1E7|nr:hypothetical protein [Blastococcus sp. CT_GayMR16]TFV90403.1 hypothetical protein E4P38_02890 [Blastococcus sp. CT_GayMR16]